MAAPGDDRVRQFDYQSNTGRRDHNNDGTRPYLGDFSGDLTLEQNDSEGYDSHALDREDSRSPLHPPAGISDGYPLPPGAASNNHSQNQLPYLTPPQPAPTTSSGNRVHYPPSPYIANTKPLATQNQSYHSVPLKDANDSSPISRGNSPLPGPGSGTNTPSGGKSKRTWGGFLGMSSHQPSMASVDTERGEKGHNGNGIGQGNGNGSMTPKKRPKSSRTNSWDLLGDRGEWEEYNPSQAKLENLRFAEGDVGTNKLSRFYYWAINRSIVLRWAFYIIPILAILWIPGIIDLAGVEGAKIWEVPMEWWSIWLTVVWVGFWAATAAFIMVPGVFRQTVGNIIPSMRKYTDIIRNLGKYAKLIFWMLAVWISFTPLVINHYGSSDTTSTSRSNLTTMANIMFGLFLCTIVLGIEKLIIQLIALQFHQDSYEDRLKDQKFQVKCLTTLYINSHDIPGRSDTLRDDGSAKTKGSQIPKIAIRKALRGLKDVAQTTTTAIGNVASEMAGQSVLQTNSPANKVTAALASANKSKALARRLYYSFRAPGADHLDISDVARYFPDLETAQAAFEVFDKDGNGDATRDEIESAILALHRDRLSLEASMRDLDGAVRRLDDIFMVIVLAIVILVLAAMVTTKLTTLVTSAGTFILGLSWLIGSTMQEILLSCIFLFVKHPYDVGDRIDVDGNSYTVAKMQLLSSSFKRTDGKYVWIGHNVLATKVIENVRRSGPTSETFVFEVDFETTFEALQTLRAKMLNFVKENSRDFLPIFDVVVDDIPAQGKMVLKADIKYKSNWQQGALKVQRKNKWICALKLTLAELKIWGPAGAGDPAPAAADPVKYTLVPWEQVNTADSKPESPPPTFHAATTAARNAASLTDRREVVNDSSQDIWDEQDELGMMTAGPSRAGTPGPNTPIGGPSAPSSATTGGYPLPSRGPAGDGNANARHRMPPSAGGEAIEMTSAPASRRPW